MSEDKKFISTAAAISHLTKGDAVYADITDGYFRAKKIDKTTFQTTIHVEGQEAPDVAYGGIQNVIKTFNRKDLKNALYLKQ